MVTLSASSWPLELEAWNFERGVPRLHLDFLAHGNGHFLVEAYAAPQPRAHDRLDIGAQARKLPVQTPLNPPSRIRIRFSLF
jgi:hypothetical protein